eukprot:CAMPEP_0197701894 /NCGR_PEP_ID=MMETSP1338-20131121/123825_1 /TAXON_ID=43686 ORGANISM="Pelagodinium beii, Strain RCC1491" /NCGR_SAMPLE_ID=MMETSP1338 /ASSEMBLY_ACC=CAM_ASM_000754 /LENGTH=125 /DNA_ID=CAMNT_0043285653 /DNA_START=1541 /DNA_END=1917 /DNA_ORIENTATION=-
MPEVDDGGMPQAANEFILVTGKLPHLVIAAVTHLTAKSCPSDFRVHLRTVEVEPEPMTSPSVNVSWKLEMTEASSSQRAGMKIQALQEQGAVQSHVPSVLHPPGSLAEDEAVAVDLREPVVLSEP